ncbi:unnamed protein product [Adineta ricciae]|uniref:G-protein coupled receptors family 1 profile domain-containing protein n=1 Tax=Adineta ricciae TaxID=249248 RepID=A0A815UTH9_ADIRI|nr:unnamed protein product [Adineta ricciae]CAF1589767.1 unnamed protein product [Adineta ricciae]
MNDSADVDSPTSSYINVALNRLVCLILFSIFIIPSTLLALYICYWICRLDELRTRLTNHSIIFIFIIGLIQETCEMPFLLAFLRSGRVPFETYRFCKFWIAFNYSLNTSLLFLNAHLSVDRYLFIIHPNILNKYKTWIHYAPMATFTLIAIIYSCSAVLFYPCEEHFSYVDQLCGGSCYQLEAAIGTFDVIFTVYMPLSCIIFFNVLLCMRVMLQRRRMRQKNVWKKNVGMLGQLLSVSAIHTIVWLPVTIVLVLAATSERPSDLLIELQTSFVLINIIYLSVLGNPVVCVFALPEIKQKMRLLIDNRRRRMMSDTKQNAIHPMTTNRAVIMMR